MPTSRCITLCDHVATRPIWTDSQPCWAIASLSMPAMKTAGSISMPPLPADAMTLFCGPMRMLDAARHAWEVACRPLTDLRYETFGSSGLLPTEAFRVRLRDAGVEFVIPQDRSMLDVLNDAG